MLTTYQAMLLRFWQCQRDFPGLDIGEPPHPTLETLGVVTHKSGMATYSPVSEKGCYLAEQQRAEAEREFRRME